MLEGEIFGPVGSEKNKEYIDHIASSGRHLRDLVTKVMDVARRESGKANEDIQKINLFELVHEGRDLFSQDISKKSLNITIDINRSRIAKSLTYKKC